MSPAPIGIVGCSAEGAALCYRTIVHESAALLGRDAHPEIAIHTHSLAAYVDCLDRGDLGGVGDLMLSSAQKLAAAGAAFLICPDNTIHQALPAIRDRSPLPWLHIAEVVADEAVSRGFRRIGITGTHWLVESDVYPAALGARGIGWLRPDAPDRATTARIIMDELVRGRLDPASTERLVAILARLHAAGCDAAVLGCTELPLVLSEANSPLPVLDSTRLLARAALRRSLRDALFQRTPSL